ncbi:unnamed protein product [Mytilus coruscus]|uniref:Uncharacterized protein n=1 Tax=Mytilus coruscus TaxID=42192 RepID=A0A6J8C6P1_MYTCO|nr:unnamed protein product [Mytilus coruscus]
MENRLEMVQRRAARYVTNRYHNTSSVSDMLNQLEWKTDWKWYRGEPDKSLTDIITHHLMENRLEMVQKPDMTNRYHNTSSVSDMLNQLEWKTDWKWYRARYVTNRYHNTSSVSDMLNQLEWKTDWKWYRGEQPDMSLTDIITHHLLVTCLTN